MRALRHKIQFAVVAIILILVYGFKFNVEAYCPFGAIETFYTHLTEGKMLCALGSGNLFALIAIIVITMMFRRVFCGYVCPIGAVSEFLRTLAKDFDFKQIQVSEKLDRRLGWLRYLILAAVLCLTAATVNLFYRNISPCYLMASINNDIKLSTYIVGGIFLVASFMISMPFCRWFCPFAVIQNLFSRFGLTRIARDADSCVNCGKCSKSCPMNIDVAHCKSITSAECIACFECVEVCPVPKTGKPNPLTWRWFGKRAIGNAKSTVITVIVMGVVATAAASLLLDFPTFSYRRDIPQPEQLEKTVLKIRGITCSGSAKLFTYFLDRKDISEIEGYLKVATRPRPGWIEVTVWFDPAKASHDDIAEAVIEAYYDPAEQRWRPSPFEVKGFDLLDI